MSFFSIKDSSPLLLHTPTSARCPPDNLNTHNRIVERTVVNNGSEETDSNCGEDDAKSMSRPQGMSADEALSYLRQYHDITESISWL